MIRPKRKAMELKIISDGTSDGTKVVDWKTGEVLEGVTNVEWSIGVGEIAVAKIELNMARVELIIPKAKIVKPIKKKIKLIP